MTDIEKISDAHRFVELHSGSDTERWEWADAPGCPEGHGVEGSETEYVFPDGSRIVTCLSEWDFGVHETLLNEVQAFLDEITDEQHPGYGAEARTIWPESSRLFDPAWIKSDGGAGGMA